MDIVNNLELRQAAVTDISPMLELLKSVCEEGDSLPFLDGIDQDMIQNAWLKANACILAYSQNDLLGMYRSGPAMPGRGSHVATATFLVSKSARNCGVGRALVAHCMETSRSAGFRAMQFNQVLSTNTAALALYKSLGFQIAGMIPEAFEHASLGYVDAYILHRAL
jgi:ribosomal protein S18 acetylase RimI-like enzyme